MIIDGKAIASDILARVKEDVSRLKVVPHMTVFTCVPNFETQKFLALKQKRASEAGIEIKVVVLSSTIRTSEVVENIKASLVESDGVVVQLPFPASIDVEEVLAAIPASHDVDVLFYSGGELDILPPVVGAIAEIAQSINLDWFGKKVAIVGRGRLVGAPAALYAESCGAKVVVLEKDTVDNDEAIKQADILILGAGVPGLVNASLIKEGVVVFDAGTSEEGGLLVGDATLDVVEVASVVTPVPGGIGPITIAILLRNVLKLALLHSKNTNNML